MSDRNARSRVPTSGRSNVANVRNENSRSNSARGQNIMSGRSGLSSEPITVSTARRAALNDPIEVFRPYSPEGRVMDGYKYNPPVLPSSCTDQLIPNYETGRRSYSRPLTCPTQWIEKHQQADILDKSAFITHIDEDSKVKMCRSFVERNRDRLWKLDSSTYKKTPRTVANEILQDPYFVTRMAVNLNKERNYKLSNSENTAAALSSSGTGRSDNGNNTTRHISITSDPFSSSLTTSRDIRKEKMGNILAPALLQYGRKHQRGYDHAIDFGNFSKYNGVLKTNQATTMNR